MRKSLTTPDKLDLAAIRQGLDASATLQLLDKIETLLSLPTPMHPGGVNEEFARGWDSGFNTFRREARKLFGVGDD